MKPFSIHPDIADASTLPGEAYCDPEVYAAVRERIFARSWQLLGDTDSVATAGMVQPLTLLAGSLDEPLLLSRDEAGLQLLSNVCTHRGNLLCTQAGPEKALVCRYHGRKFALNGSCRHRPGFEKAEGAVEASEADDLPRVPFGEWGKFLFASLQPSVPLAEVIGPMQQRMPWLDVSRLRLDPTRSRDYLVQANWALYCDNYLEGLHIPFVHPGLNQVLDPRNYRTELFRWCTLQRGVAKRGADHFVLPPSSPDYGEEIAAYYWWIFPNTMINVYPWGVSVNLVRPLGVDRTQVSFLSYVGDESRLEVGAGAGLDTVELEDEAVVESVQRGVRSRLYGRGRYSPTGELGVHHFHRLWCEAMAEDPGKTA